MVTLAVCLAAGPALAQQLPCPSQDNPGGVSSSAGGLSTGLSPGALGNNATVGGLGATGANCVPQPPLTTPQPGPPPAMTQPMTQPLTPPGLTPPGLTPPSLTPPSLPR